MEVERKLLDPLSREGAWVPPFPPLKATLIKIYVYIYIYTYTFIYIFIYICIYIYIYICVYIYTDKVEVERKLLDPLSREGAWVTLNPKP